MCCFATAVRIRPVPGLRYSTHGTCVFLFVYEKVLGMRPDTNNSPQVSILPRNNGPYDCVCQQEHDFHLCCPSPPYHIHLTGVTYRHILYTHLGSPQIEGQIGELLGILVQIGEWQGIPNPDS